MNTTIKKQAAPAMEITEAGGTKVDHNRQSDYTPTPTEAQESFKKSIEALQGLPAEMRPDFVRLLEEKIKNKKIIENVSGQMLTQKMMIQILGRRANGEKFEMDSASFVEPYNRYWKALEKAAPGDEREALKTAGATDGEIMRIIESKLNLKNYPALAEFQETIKDVSWYWDYRIPNGKLTLLGGESGVSKSMLAQRICYMQIHDKTFPDGTPIHNPGAPVLYVDCEGFASGMKMRAKAWNMDTSKFYFWTVDNDKDGFIDFSNPAYRDELIERVHAIEPKPALIVIDSLGNASSSGQDKVEDVRELLNFLNQIAYNFDLALVLIAHTRKPPAMFTGKGELTQDDIRGSSHLVAMARAVIGVWLVQTGSEPDPNGPRVMAVIKSNYGRKPKAIGYEVLSDANGNPRMSFGDPPKAYKEPSKAQQCAEWLLETLEGEGKPMKPKDLEAMAALEGFKRDTFYVAHRLLEKDKRIMDTHGQQNPENAWKLLDPQS